MKPEHEALCKRLEDMAETHEGRYASDTAALLREAALAVRALSEAPDAKDGERYRWLKAHPHYYIEVYDPFHRNRFTSATKGLDAAIDAALSGKESRDGGAGMKER